MDLLIFTHIYCLTFTLKSHLLIITKNQIYFSLNIILNIAKRRKMYAIVIFNDYQAYIEFLLQLSTFYQI